MTQMVTTCPSCRQQLAVTPADLRVGQGFVRCGRCDKVFNALLTLAEDAPVPEEAASVARGTTSVPALEEGEDLPPLPGREEPIPFGGIEDVEVMETNLTGRFRSLELEADQAQAQGEESPAAPPALQAGDADPDADELARSVVREVANQPIDILLQDTEPTEIAEQSPPSAIEEEFDADAALGNRRRAGWGWSLAAVLLALVLAAQWVHHNRHQLAGKPWASATIGRIYGLMGRTVEPPWDLAQYEVLSLGGMDLRGDSRTVVLRTAVAVKKDAPFAQPPPLIRAELSDLRGNVLSRTTLAARDWMLGDAPARLAPGERLDGQVSLPAPQGVSSFVLAACLPDAAGALRCYGDP